MEHPFAKSVTAVERVKRLLETVSPEDSLAILIDADPDSMASALAIKRIFWRKVRKAAIYRINEIQRADNLALVRLLKIDQRPISELEPENVTKWAVVDSQPPHHDRFGEREFDVIIDHHPVHPASRAAFMDIREHYGANATILTEYLKAAKIRPSMRLATALFYGIKTDTNNFVRGSLTNDVNAFRYLFRYANMNMIKKIESSEMTRKTLKSYETALQKLRFHKDVAWVYMGEVSHPDLLVMIADFFMRLAEANWSMAAGVHEGRLVVILRNVGLRGDAGKTAQRLFEPWGIAGGHRTAARAEMPLERITGGRGGRLNPERFLTSRFRLL